MALWLCDWSCLLSIPLQSVKALLLKKDEACRGGCTVIIVPTRVTGAFVWHRQNTPWTNTTHSSAATLQTDPNFTAVWSLEQIQSLGSWDRCCAGNILVESSGPQAQGHWRSAANPSAFRLKKRRDTSSQAFKVYCNPRLRVLKSRNWFRVSFF